MKDFENLLVTVAEECSEIGQATAKALRFGLLNCHPDKPNVTNAEEIMYEYLQLSAVIEMLQKSGHLPKWDDVVIQTVKRGKTKNIERYQNLSLQCRTLDRGEW